MKEKITDLFDDIPVELLDEIEVQKGKESIFPNGPQSW